MRYVFDNGMWAVVDDRQSGLKVASILIVSTGEFKIEFDSRYETFEFIEILKPGKFQRLDDAKAYLDKLPTIAELDATICKLFKVAKESEGVTGWHENGDVADWNDLINTDHLYL